MTDLKRQLRSTAKQGNQFPALVVDVFYDKATVRLSNNGAILRNLSVVGGPVIAGQKVSVDFTTDTPYVVALGQDQLEISDIQSLIDSLDTVGQTSLFVWQILWFSQGVLASFYPPDATGLTQALTDADDGIVMIPALSVTGSFTVPSNVSLIGIDKERSQVLGSLTVYGSLYNLAVINSGSSSSELYAILAAPNVYDCVFRGVKAEAINAGTGNAVGAVFGSSRVMIWEGCHFYGNAEGGGSGYGIRVSGDQVAKNYVRGGYVGGSTYPYLVD